MEQTGVIRKEMKWLIVLQSLFCIPTTELGAQEVGASALALRPSLTARTFPPGAATAASTPTIKDMTFRATWSWGARIHFRAFPLVAIQRSMNGRESSVSILSGDDHLALEGT